MPPPSSLASILGQASVAPDGIAVRDGETVLTYAELDARSAAVAAGLRERGVGRGDLVAVCMQRSWRNVAAILGVVRAGAAYVPLSAESPLQRLRTLIDLAEPAVAIGDAGTVGRLPAELDPLDFETLLAAAGEPPELGGEDDPLVYVLFTSGSTGVPKGVEIGEAEMLQLLATGCAMLPIAGDVCLSIAPTEFDLSALEIWGALAVGATLVIVPPGRPDPAAVGALIRAAGVTWAYFAAGFFGQVARAALSDFGGLRLVAAGGDVMPRAAATALREAHPGVRVINGYGPTETTISCSEFEVGELDDEPVPIGKPLRGYEFHVLDEEGEPVADGEPGELWIGGAGISRGYRGDPERTADRFRTDLVPRGGRLYGSGDIVRRLPSGDFAFLGRVDDQVKIAGYRVEPGEVTQALGLHPSVRHAAVVAREDVAGHKRLVAYTELRDGVVTAEELREFLGERLPAYMVPGLIEILPELPLTERGKVDRGALPEPSRGGGEEAATAGETAATVAALMAEVLGVRGVGADESFFHLGADSLLAIQLLGRLRERLGTGIDVTAVFAAPTPRHLAAALDAEGPGERRPPLTRSEEPGPAPASFAQRRAWLFERMNPDSLAYQFAAIIHFEGELVPAAMRGAVADLIARHEVLRTQLAERDGEVVQVVLEDVETPFEELDLRGEDEIAWTRAVRSRVRRRIALGRAPMLRLTLVRRGERRWSLIDVEHHAIHDGWSFTVFLHELSELYSARVEGREARLPPMSVQLGDFARWERRLLDDGRRRAQLEHWRHAIDPDPPLLELRPGRPRAARESFAGGSIRRGLDPELAARLRELARESDVTFFQVCFAAFAVLLGRVGSVSEVQIGTGLANRRDRAAEQLIGMTVETVALRLRLGDDPSVRELLGRVREAVLGGLANSDVPFDAVVEELSPPRRPGRSPLIQTLFSFDDAPPSPVRWSGLEHEVVQAISNRTAKADLNVIGIDHGDRDPLFIWEHSELLDDADASRLSDHHVRLLEQFAADPEVRLSSLELLGPDEREELRAWEVGDGSYDRSASIPDLVRRRTDLEPEAVAVRAGDETLTYSELLERGLRVAGALREAGVEPGDRVGLLSPRTPASVAAHLGVLLAGAAYVPLDPSHPAKRVAAALTDAGVGVALLGGEPAALPETVRPLAIAAALAAEPGEPAAIGPEDLAYVMYTSGSTGSPKAVEVTHRNVVRLLDGPAFADLGPGTTMLHSASTAFDAATLEIWGPLLNGGTVVPLAGQPHPEAIAAAILREGVDTLWLTAGLFHELVDRRPQCLAAVRQLLAGGDVLSPEHVARALAALPQSARLVNGYGPTETTTFALTHELRPGDEVRGPIPLGRPVQGAVCAILDAGEKPVPVGVAGELWIGGDGVARGYGNDPELSAERFLPDPERSGARRYRSGDRAFRDADGLVHFLGRTDRQLKIRGFRVAPGEVEAVLRDHPRVADAAVVAREDRGGAGLVAYLVASGGADELDPADLREHAAARLPPAMLPAAWVTMPRLPLTANGKLDPERLPTPERRHLAAAGDGAAPSRRRERQVVEAFEAILGVSPVGVEDDFFALGGHSLLAVELFTRLERIARRRLSLALVFEAPTPRELAARLGEDRPAEKGWNPLVALKPEGSLPPLFVVSAGDGNIVGFGPLARSLSPEQPLYALQPSGLQGGRRLDAGIGAMAERYVEAMRAVRPHGPYLLAGRCNGATVAYEMAQRLRAAGEEVPLLASLDSEPPPAGPFEVCGIPFDQVMEILTLRAARDGRPAPDPTAPGGEERLLAWLREPLAPGVSRYLHEFASWRFDLRRAMPDPLGADAEALAWFAWQAGLPEIDPRLLLPAPVPDCRPEPLTPWDGVMESCWEDAGRTPPDPLHGRGWAEFASRLRRPAGGGTNRYLLAARDARPDLVAAFPDPEGESAPALRDWAWQAGVDEGLAPSLLPPPATPLPRRRRAELAWRDAAYVSARAAGRAGAIAVGLRDAGRIKLANALERRLGRPLPRARQRIEVEVVAAARQARATYRSQPWPGRVVLITSVEMAAKPAFLAWEQRALGGVEVVPLQADHVGMLRAPGVAELAAALEASARQALAPTRERRARTALG